MKKRDATLTTWAAPLVGAAALLCIGLSSALDGAAALRVQAQTPPATRPNRLPALHGSPPYPRVSRWPWSMHPALDGNPLRFVPVSAAPKTGAGAAPALGRLSSRSVLGTSATRTRGGLLTIYYHPLTLLLGLRDGLADSPPKAPTAPGNPLVTLSQVTSRQAWYVGPPASSAVLLAVIGTGRAYTARHSSLGLERVLDSQTQMSRAPEAVPPPATSMARTLVLSAQRPRVAPGLRLTGVHPADTTFSQPPTATPIPPTATPVPPTATAIPPTATPVPPTDTPIPPTATSFVPAPPTATPAAPASPQPTPAIVQAGYSASATPTPALGSPSSWTATTMPGGNAHWYYITGYLPTGNRTRTGTIPRFWSTVAVDPSVIPLGSTVYIQGLGVFRAEDTGGAIQGYRVDVFVPTLWDANHITGNRLVSFIPPS